MILVITANRITGLQYHRQIVPFRSLGLEVEYQPTEEGLTDDYLKKFSIISVLRDIKYPEKYKKLGLKIHFDIDDYWVLPVSHGMCKIYKQMDYANKTIYALNQADFITTTTQYLADKIQSVIKPTHIIPIHVLPNAIDPYYTQWIPYNFEPSHERMRFGYIAGSHHQKDVEMLHPELIGLYNDKTVEHKWQLLAAGYNFTPNQDGTVTSNPYYKYIEKLFTCRITNSNAVSLLKKQYAEQLNKEMLCEYRDMDEPYQRINGKDVYSYGKLYDLIDVSMIPLVNNDFNRCKSQLKLIEAGFKKKACLVSDVIPYSLDKTKDNAMYVTDKEWRKSIKYLIMNPNKVEDLKESMYQYVNERYRIDIVNKERKQIFESWLKLG